MSEMCFAVTPDRQEAADRIYNACPWFWDAAKGGLTPRFDATEVFNQLIDVVLAPATSPGPAPGPSMDVDVPFDIAVGIAYDKWINHRFGTTTYFDLFKAGAEWAPKYWERCYYGMLKELQLVISGRDEAERKAARMKAVLDAAKFVEFCKSDGAHPNSMAMKSAIETLALSVRAWERAEGQKGAEDEVS